MAAEEEIEYESDPEEAKLSLKMRRREASDDEADEGSGISAKPPRRAEIEDSAGESEGAAADYEDEYEEDCDLEEEYAGGVEEAAEETSENVDTFEINETSENVEDGQHEGEKKEIEPFAVPTAGAFYMHDDRFRGTPRGRNRRMLGGRKLWESKDDRKWGHDKFEELTGQERGYEEHRRGSRGRNRGRGRNRAATHGYAQGNGPRELTSNGTQADESQNSAPKSFRGRGPRMYRPLSKNKAPFTQNKQSGKSNEKPSYVSYEKATSGFISNAEPNVAFPRKESFASNLNIASPPFYPSGSSTKVSNVPSKRDVHADAIKDGSFTTDQSSGRKNSIGSIGMDKLYIDESVPPSTTQQLRGRGRGTAALNQMVYQPVASNNQVNRVNPSGQSRAQSFVQGSGQQFRVQSPSPPKTTGAVNPVGSGELEAPSESNKSKTVLVSKGKGGAQGSGGGSFLYGGTHVMGASGNMGSGHGDPNFPTFLPMMQFSGQHSGGIGVPAVGMAFPGYVGQPQHGRGNSEMTWLPVLAGAAGALGARYPYISVDGSYHARPSGQISSVTAASSKENSTTNAGNEWEHAERPEPASDDLGQRQKNPRRYTEMKFDQ